MDRENKVMNRRKRLSTRLWQRRAKLVSKFFPAFVLTAFCFASATAQEPHITVRKQARDRNPGLSVEFNGPEGRRQHFMRVLKLADWFRVVSREEARFHLKAVWTNGPLPGVRIEVKGRSKSRRASLEAGDRSEEATGKLVLRSVDRVINLVFGNPGPCSSRFAFVAARGGGKEIFSCRFDMNNLQQITHNETISTEPDWGSGGNSLVYTMYGLDRTRIVQVDVEQRRQRVLTGAPGLNAGADLDRKGRRAVLAMTEDGTVDLFILNLNNGERRRLTRSAAVESSPDWGPDGRRIVFVSDRGGSPQLYTIAVDSGRISRVETGPQEAVSPDWSPVSDSICYSTKRKGRYVLAKLDMGEDGAQPHVFAQGGGDWQSPSWGPDGRHVLATRNKNGASELCLVDAWYGTVTRLTSTGRYSLPSWSGHVSP